MKNEYQIRKKHVRRNRELISSLLKTILSEITPANKRELVAKITEYCLMPRILRSQSDAVFCHEFINLTHSVSAANFPTVFILDKIVKVVFQTISMMTTSEVDATAVFMSLFFVQLERWRVSH